LMPTAPEYRREIANARRRVNRVRDFPRGTCPASRHLHMIADALGSHEKYHMLDEEPEHCAITMYAVLESLWKLRAEKAARSIKSRDRA
jgi:hypothetical protein